MCSLFQNFKKWFQRNAKMKRVLCIWKREKNKVIKTNCQYKTAIYEYNAMYKTSKKRLPVNRLHSSEYANTAIMHMAGKKKCRKPLCLALTATTINCLADVQYSVLHLPHSQNRKWEKKDWIIMMFLVRDQSSLSLWSILTFSRISPHFL